MSQSAAKYQRPSLDALLTAAALPLGVLTADPGAGWSMLLGWPLALALLAWLPLLVRDRWPRAVLALAAAINAAGIAVVGARHPAGGGALVMVPIATMLALYTLSNRYRPVVTWSAAAVVAAAQFTAGALSLPKLGGNLLYFNWPLVAAALGQMAEERRARIAEAEARADEAERVQHAEAARQVTAERMRIARDLHDVLAHHVTVVNAQAGVARYLLHTDPQAADKALAGIAENTKAALDELRATLGLLRDESEEGTRAPTPGSAELGSLVKSFTDAGMDLSMEVRGTPRPLSGPADVAMYRIAQEALTNASKHAPGATVEVEIAWSDRLAELVVTNAAPPSGAATAKPVDLGTGHGLMGMRERAGAGGGSLSTGATAGGGYRVALSLPVAPRGPAQ
jgi:signal transduction histidine kinase